MFLHLSRYRWQYLTAFFIVLFASYFSYLTILRFHVLYASYFDLGIMHQTVFNTYRALQNLNPERILELTNPFGPEQIKRMSIHNDVLLAFLAPFYFIHSGPETLLVIQSVVMALGAWLVYKIAMLVLVKQKHSGFLSFTLALSFLLFPAIERGTFYEFHAVTLATTFLLAMYYFWKIKKYYISLVFFLLSIFAKEEVALTTGFFALYCIYVERHSKTRVLWYPLLVLIISYFWFLVSLFLIIPHFRGSVHFALGYYGDFGDSPAKILVGLLKNPVGVAHYIFHIDTFRYFWFLLGPVGFLGFLSPIHLAIAAPEFAINLFSNNWNMRNIVFHYTAVIQPFVFIASVYGLQKSIELIQWKTKFKYVQLGMGIYILVMSLLFSYFKSPLPYSLEREVHPFLYPQPEAKEVAQWSSILRSEGIKVSSTGQLAPYFTSRRYFYAFSPYYELADYIVLRPGEIYNYPEKSVLIPIYEKLANDTRYQKIYKSAGLEVFKKLK